MGLAGRKANIIRRALEMLNPSKNEVNTSQDTRGYYLNEFWLFDGDHYITFNIVDVDTVRNEITVAVSDEGRISVCTFDLISDGDYQSGRLFFEYGVTLKKIAVDDFEQVGEDGYNGQIR